MDLNYALENNFCDDTEKMVDFINLSKEEFLESYSYLTEEEYEATKLYVLTMLHYVFHVIKPNREKFFA